MAVAATTPGGVLMRNLALTTRACSAPPPLRKAENQENNGQTGSPCLEELVLAQGGLNRSGVDPPLSSSRACLTTFIANSVP